METEELAYSLLSVIVQCCKEFLERNESRQSLAVVDCKKELPEERIMVGLKADRRDLLSRLVAAIEGSEPKQIKEVKREFREVFLYSALYYCRSNAWQLGIMLDDRTTTKPLSPNVIIPRLAREAVDEVLKAVEQKVRTKEKVTIKYINKSLYYRCRDAVKRESIFPEEKLVSLDEPRGSEEDETIGQGLQDPVSYDPLDILIAQENLAERLRSSSTSLRSFLQMLKEIWSDDEKRQRFRDTYLIDSKKRLAFFNRWGHEFEATSFVSEKALGRRVLTWYSQEFSADRRAYDMTSHLKDAMAQFLSTEANH